MKKITVLLSDDHPVVRQGLRLLLETEPDLQVVDEAASGRRAVGETKRPKPDVILLDLAMPLLNGLEAARQIAKEIPAAKVLILSVSPPRAIRFLFPRLLTARPCALSGSQRTGGGNTPR